MNAIVHKVLLVVASTFLTSIHALYAQPVVIPIETQSNALVLFKDSAGYVTVGYFGKKMSNQLEYAMVPSAYRQTDDYTGLSNSVYTPSGSKNILEPAISVVHADGNQSLDLRYVAHRINKVDDNVSILELILKDPIYDLTVTLYYKSYFKQDMMEQWATIEHNEKGNVILHKFASANLTLKAPCYWLRQYHGDWAMEMQPEDSRITHGIKTIDSKLGTRANLFQPSSFMISLDKPAAEDTGEVLFGTLEYSGNFKIDLELDYLNNLRIIAGINNYASAYTLKPKEKFTTPTFSFTLSNQGKGKASRNMHDWARNYKILDGQGDRLTLLNNWEATYFDFNEQKLKGLLSDTKKLGVDLFLLDDGWFANKYPRNDDHTGLGDWQENKTKLPNGIASLIKEASDVGVKFGIWVEPEMVSPKSELYEKHPEWVIKQPRRDEHYFRNQLVLDLSNPAVQDFVFGVLDDLFTKNPEIAYIKWDCNSIIYNAYSPYLEQQEHFYIAYMRGLYKVLERIRAKYPKVPMMLCSGGGGRVDYAALKYFTEFWPSDNTDPLERIFMQYEYSYFYPSISTSNHVTDWGKQSLKFKTDVAMMGKLGFDIVISHLDEKDLLFSQQAVALYDQVKNTIWYGDQYRLADPREGNFAAIQYMDNDRSSGIIFNYLVNNRYNQGTAFPVRLKGLEANRKYTIQEINLYPETMSSLVGAQEYSGEFLMQVGFNPDLNTDRKSVVLKIEVVN